MHMMYDNKGHTLGYTTSNGVNTFAYGSKGQTVGRYNKSDNTTYNNTGQRVSSTNALSAMIYNNSQKTR